MTDRQAFIDAIIAQPDDDLPRLIFADWLDEQGEGERAEFIRVQCELASMAIPPQHVDRPWSAGQVGQMVGYLDITGRTKNTLQRCDCRNCALRIRERELKPPGNIAWHICWAEGATIHFPAGQVFRRGFIEELQCSWLDWQTNASAIRSATPLRKVRLTTWPGTISSESNLGRTVAVMELGKSYPSIEFELPQLRADVVPNDHWVDDLENAILHGDPSARRPMGILHAR